MTPRYFKALGREFFIEATRYRPAGLFEVIQDGPKEREVFAFGYRMIISG